MAEYQGFEIKSRGADLVVAFEYRTGVVTRATNADGSRVFIGRNEDIFDEPGLAERIGLLRQHGADDAMEVRALGELRRAMVLKDLAARNDRAEAALDGGGDQQGLVPEKRTEFTLVDMPRRFEAHGQAPYGGWPD
jgi:hypothetical protein